MDPNVKDVLLVLLGAIASLLGSSITIFIEFRRDREIEKRERKVKDYERLIEYLLNFSQLNAVLATFFGNQQFFGTSNPSQYFESNLTPVLRKLSDSPLNGLPPILMTRDKHLIDRLGSVVDRLQEIQITLTMMSNGKYQADMAFAKKQFESLRSLNTLIDGLITEIEKKL